MAVDTAEKKGKDLKIAEAAPPVSVAIGPNTTIDLSWMPEEERNEMLTEHTGELLKISRKHHEHKVDAGALRDTLDATVRSANEAAQGGSAITVSNVQESTLGRFEVMVGNTDQARSGKLPQSQTGERNWTPFYVIGGLIAAVLIVATV